MSMFIKSILNQNSSKWGWFVLALMTIFFSGPIRRYVEMQWKIDNIAAAARSGDKRVKMSVRLLQEKQYVAGIRQSIINPPSALPYPLFVNFKMCYSSSTYVNCMEYLQYWCHPPLYINLQRILI